jgi:hypothetical protein
MSNKEDGFLPKGYTPATSSDFMKLGEGANNIRILSKPLIGKLYWVSPDGLVREKGKGQKGDKPFRIEYSQKLPKEVLEFQTKEFWAMKVYDYKDEAIKILEITQASILRSLYEFVNDPKWGDLRKYDVNIKREGSGMDTKYFVMPSPPTPLTAEVIELSNASEIDLSTLLSPVDTSDPFEGMEVDEQDIKDVKKSIRTSEPDEEDVDGKELPF